MIETLILLAAGYSHFIIPVVVTLGRLPQLVDLFLPSEVTA